MTTIAQTASAAGRSDTLLRRALQLDAVASIGSTAAALLAAGPISAFTGIPAPLVQTIGAVFLVFTATIVYGSTRPVIDRRIAWVIMIANFSWVALSAAALIFGWLPLTPAGFWVVVAQAVLVDLLAVAQFLGLRRGR